MLAGVNQAARKRRPRPHSSSPRGSRNTVRSLFNVVRPFLLAGIAYVGASLAFSQLQPRAFRYEFLFWAFLLFLTGSAILGLYDEVRDRLRLRKWLRTEDPAEAMRVLPEIEKIMRRLPPWHEKNFLGRKETLRETDPMDRLQAPASWPDELVPIPRIRSMAQRMRDSALVVVAFIILVPVGAIAFLVWIQNVVAGVPGSPVALMLWLVASAFLGAVGLALFGERMEVRRRQRRRHP